MRAERATRVRHSPGVHGGGPEVMLHLRRMGLMNGRVHRDWCHIDATLDWWESSERRLAARARLASTAAVDPDHVIMSPDAARRAGLTSTVVFPRGNLPQGAVIKATAIDSSVTTLMACIVIAVRRECLVTSARRSRREGNVHQTGARRCHS